MIWSYKRHYTDKTLKSFEKNIGEHTSERA